MARYTRAPHSKRVIFADRPAWLKGLFRLLGHRPEKAARVKAIALEGSVAGRLNKQEKSGEGGHS